VSLAPLEVALPTRWAVGSPLIAAITLRIAAPAARRHGLRLPSLARTAGAIGLWLVNDVRLPVARVEAADGDDGHRAHFSLGSGEARRILIEISPLLPRSLAPGRYTLQLGYASGGGTVAPPLPIDVAMPSRDEEQALAALTPALEEGWGSWPWQRGDAPAGPFDPRDPLLYLRVLRYLCRGPHELAAVDPAVLDVLRASHGPESLALRAELAWARGDRASFESLAEHVRRHAPGVVWWLDAIAAGQSDLAFRRAHA
jgi:hypothetical protein